MEPEPRVSSLFVTDRKLRRRRIVNRAMEGLATFAALIAVAVLVIVVASVVKNGWSALNLDFFTKTPAFFGQEGGGIANSIVGSVLLIAFATLFSLPVGVLIAIYVSELAPRKVANVIRLALDVMNGLPTIVTGIFIFSILVISQGQSALAGAVALGIIALPLVSRSTQEVLRLVPSSLREAGLALGAPRWRTVLGVILPSSMGGILTGTTLAIARVAGETAPLLFTTSLAAMAVTWDPTQPVQSMPLTIFQYAESPDPADHARAWATGIVLLAFVLILSLTSRFFLARSRRKLSR
ncbi:MAG TPA: phosphate ABC transporter permease PstA [Gaiellaceae bacterium]